MLKFKHRLPSIALQFPPEVPYLNESEDDPGSMVDALSVFEHPLTRMFVENSIRTFLFEHPGGRVFGGPPLGIQSFEGTLAELIEWRDEKGGDEQAARILAYVRAAFARAWNGTMQSLGYVADGDAATRRV